MAVAHKIGGPDTCWIFVSATQEARHLDDLVFCVDILRRRGVKNDRVLVFTDHAAASTHLTPHNIATIHALSDMGSVLRAVDARYAVAVCGGHGAPFGLRAGSGTNVSPHTLLTSVASVQSLEVAVILLCQCYAGSFHFMDSSHGGKKFVVIGSTNFYPTLSSSVTLGTPISAAGAPALATWQANVYQLNLFGWIGNPQDIDGDGELTLVDAYKFAGIATIQAIQNIWVGAFSSLQQKQKELADAEAAGKSKVELDAYRDAIKDIASMLYNIQEPWLLNARLAPQIGFV